MRVLLVMPRAGPESFRTPQGLVCVYVWGGVFPTNICSKTGPECEFHREAGGSATAGVPPPPQEGSLGLTDADCAISVQRVCSEAGEAGCRSPTRGQAGSPRARRLDRPAPADQRPAA